MSQEFQQQPTSGQYGGHEQMGGQQGHPQGQPMQSQGGMRGSQMGGGMQQPSMRGPQGTSDQMGGAQGPTQQMQGSGTGQMQGGASMQPQFEDHLTNELRIALDDLNDVSHIAEWCAKECTRAGPQMATCARICEDIADLAEINERWIARDSMFGPDLAEQFVRIATEALPELEQHQQAHAHVSETIHAISRAIESCETVLQMTGQQQQQMPQSGTGGQMGGRMSGGQQPMGGQQF